MKWFLVLCGLQAALAAVLPEGQNEGTILYYHDSVGVSEAARIKAKEDLEQSTRLTGGSSPVTPGESPWLVGLLVLLIDGRTSVCSASLVSNTKLVTAAHCWNDGRNQATSLTAVLGSPLLFYGGVRLFSDTVETHPNFNSANLNNDVAIVTIPWVEYNDIIKPVNIPTSFYLFLTFEGNNALAAGYGVRRESDSITLEQEARQQALEVINNVDCGQFYGFNVIDSTLCTNGIYRTGPCGGDSGGPLVFRPYNEQILIGIISFYSGTGCDTGFPGGFARVSSFSSWILARI